METEISYTIDYNEESIYWNEIIQIENIIPLETTDSSILGYAQKCIVEKKYIIYWDAKQKSIFVFNSIGESIYTINAWGSSDKEYTSIKDIILSYDKKSILVLDELAILSFDIKDGSFQYKTKLNNFITPKFNKFINTAPNVFYFCSSDKNRCICEYNNGEINIVEDERNGYLYVTDRFVSDIENSILLIPDYGSFIIKELNNGKLIYKYNIDFKEKSLPESMIPTNYKEFKNIDKSNYIKCLLSIHETKNNLYIETATPDRNFYHILINKHTNNILSGKNNRKENLVIIDADDDYFYGLIYPAFFKSNADVYRKLKPYLNDELNPIVLKFKVNI